MSATVTLKKARDLARQSRVFGFYRVGYCDCAVNCPACHERVECEHAYGDTDAKCIDRAMVEHARFDCSALGTRDSLVG